MANLFPFKVSLCGTFSLSRVLESRGEQGGGEQAIVTHAYDLLLLIRIEKVKLIFFKNHLRNDTNA